MKSVTKVRAPVWLMQRRFNTQCNAADLCYVKQDLKTVCVFVFGRNFTTHQHSCWRTPKMRTNSSVTKATKTQRKQRQERDTRTKKRNIIYTFNECACPKLLFLITFPCDIICCKIVYAWGTFSSCQLKSIWTNQYLSILWHTHSWPLGKSCLK